MSNSYRVIIYSLIFCCLCILTSSQGIQYYLNSNLFAGKQNHYKKIVTIEKNASLSQISHTLVRIGAIKFSVLFNFIVWSRGDENALNAGDYLLVSKMTIADLYQDLRQGKVIRYKVTVPEGVRLSKILKIFSEELRLKHTLSQNIAPSSLRKILKISEKNLEGLFFPSTYQYTSKISDIRLLLSAYNMMKRVMYTYWLNRAQHLPYKHPYEALVAASLIEMESGNHEESFKISRVLVNRIEKRMPLQIDATVRYGLNYWKKKLLHKHLQINTMYNTYKRRGLPPTPIACPGKNSIYAALHPAKGNWLYFVSTGHGNHTFSRTLAKHNKAVKHLKKVKGIS